MCATNIKKTEREREEREKEIISMNLVYLQSAWLYANEGICGYLRRRQRGITLLDCTRSFSMCVCTDTSCNLTRVSRKVENRTSNTSSSVRGVFLLPPPCLPQMLHLQMCFSLTLVGDVTGMIWY